MRSSLTLRTSNLSWIDDSKDNPYDLCAHGYIDFSIDGQVLVSQEDGEFTVSSATINLLRTFENNHTTDSSLFQQLFPCCGIPMSVESNGDVLLVGCNIGVDFQVRSEDGTVFIQDETDKEFCISESQWRRAVLLFSKTVWEFYNNSSPKIISDKNDAESFDAFCNEWHRRDPDIEILNLRPSS